MKMVSDKSSMFYEFTRPNLVQHQLLYDGVPNNQWLIFAESQTSYYLTGIYFFTVEPTHQLLIHEMNTGPQE